MRIIDKKVKNYLKDRNISLPTNRKENILTLDSIISKMFCYDIEDYESVSLSSIDEHIASSNRCIWRNYMNWYLLNHYPNAGGINWRQEYEQLQEFTSSVAAFYDDEISGNGGSGTWIQWHQIEYMKNGIFKDMWMEILTRKYESCDSHVPKRCWEREFAALQSHVFYDDKTHPELVEMLKKATLQWQAKRNAVQLSLTNSKTARIYKSQTNRLLRNIFISVKCRFDDLGLRPASDTLLYEWNTPDKILFQ